MKAYIVNVDDSASTVIHAETRNKARYRFFQKTIFFFYSEYKDIRAKRAHEMDDQPATVNNMKQLTTITGLENADDEITLEMCGCPICIKAL
ncbi:MAG TPA: hypothetical protein PKW33_15495 [Anaerolineaceae bacterium]|nr:hypothetical protein [Anaerolineaceae bacterium]HPN52999.1 hypothetical protein [Anaerolineaceae bacterium]